MVGNLKKWKDGVLKRDMTIKGEEVTLTASRGESYGTSHWIDFNWDNPAITFADILEVFGELPIPPYLNRDTQESDKETYQTIYSKIKGSVAAPTAGLHFTSMMEDRSFRIMVYRHNFTGFFDTGNVLDSTGYSDCNINFRTYSLTGLTNLTGIFG